MSVTEEGRGVGSELGSDLDSDPDPWKILWIRIRNRQNGADPLDPDPQHCLIPTHCLQSGTVGKCSILLIRNAKLASLFSCSAVLFKICMPAFLKFGSVGTRAHI